MMLGSPGFGLNVTQLEVLITTACNPALPEPNYAHHLEVADYINKKKANTPREAAILIARLANHRNPHIGMLALALLDTLVQSCGYPFHLQIATKEFLNELVRRFPERPPPFPGPVMQRILDLISTWRETICIESRWKEDLGNIRDMHRLLTFKGYRFREMPRQQRQPTTSTSNLKTAEELEAEDREAQEAKLQELIRRGTPRDLAAAQELMKALAGANPDAKPDYRSQAFNELNKLEQKVILMNEMLDQVDTQKGEKFVSGDVYDQVASILVSARPRIQKWISDAEADDPESLDTYLQINDQINTVLNRYEAYKKGDYSLSSIPPELAGSSSSANAASTSLIDFEDEPSASSAPSASSGKPVDDLADLFGPSTTSTSQPHPQAPPSYSGFPANGFAQTFANQPQQRQSLQTQFQSSLSSSSSPAPPFGSLSSSNPTSPGSQEAFGTIMLPGTPQLQAQAQGMQRVASPNYLSGGNNGVGSSMGMGMGMGVSSSQPRQQQQNTSSSSQQQQQKGKDPFADLVGLF